MLVTNIPRSFSIGKAAGSGPAFCPVLRRVPLTYTWAAAQGQAPLFAPVPPFPAPIPRPFPRGPAGARRAFAAVLRLAGGGAFRRAAAIPSSVFSQRLMRPKYSALSSVGRGMGHQSFRRCVKSGSPPSLPLPAILLSTSSTCSSGTSGRQCASFFRTPSKTACGPGWSPVSWCSSLANPGNHPTDKDGVVLADEPVGVLMLHGRPPAAGPI